jgi:hypothetical protein
VCTDSGAQQAVEEPTYSHQHAKAAIATCDRLLYVVKEHGAITIDRDSGWYSVLEGVAQQAAIG